jgi:hypothetical protein
MTNRSSHDVVLRIGKPLLIDAFPSGIFDAVAALPAVARFQVVFSPASCIIAPRVIVSLTPPESRLDVAARNSLIEHFGNLTIPKCIDDGGPPDCDCSVRARILAATFSATRLPDSSLRAAVDWASLSAIAAHSARSLPLHVPRNTITP